MLNIEEQAPAPSPTICREAGKECRDCVSQCAETMAWLCPSLEPQAAQSIFLRLYPHAGCFAMARTFVREYLTHSEPFNSKLEELVA